MDEIIHIDKASVTPRYQQIINAVLQGIQANQLKKGDKIPSLNYYKQKFQLSQDTVLTAYNELKARGIIASAVGKGYYIASNGSSIIHKIFVLFDNLTAYKETLYNAMKDGLGKKGTLDIFFHHANKELFQKLVEEAAGKYTAYVIMPLENKSQLKCLNQLPEKQLFLLDRGRSFSSEKYTGVFQNFAADTYQALEQGSELIKKYNQLFIVTNDHRHHLQEIVSGCHSFCQHNRLKFNHIKNIEEVIVKAGDAFLVINDRGLVSLVEQIEKLGLTIGSQVGIISYNDTPLKQIAAGGITTISTDFVAMGKNITDLILNRQKSRIDNPAQLIIRNSL